MSPEAKRVEKGVEIKPVLGNPEPKPKMVYLVGTVHVSENSAKKVEETIRMVLPDMVCVELDIERFKALREQMSLKGATPATGTIASRGGGQFRYSKCATCTKVECPKRYLSPGEALQSGGILNNKLGTTNDNNLNQHAVVFEKKLGTTKNGVEFKDLFSIQGMLKWLQQEIGKELGVMPGLEMVSACETAMKYRLDIGLIDRPVQTTINRMWLGMKFKEKIKLVGYLGGAVGFFALKPIFGKRAAGALSLIESKPVKEPNKNRKKQGSKNKKAVPELNIPALERGEGVDELMGVLKKEFPSIYTALVEERNQYMCNNIINILKTKSTIVIVVGAGHVSGMKEILEKSSVPVRVV